MANPCIPGPSPTGNTRPWGVLKIGPVLLRSLRIWWRNAVPFLLIAGFWTVPSMLIDLVYRPPNDPFALTLHTILSSGIGSIFNGFATAMIVFGVVRDLRGRPSRTAECLVRGAAGSIRALGATVAMAVIVTIGFLALVLPGVLLELVLLATIPAAVLERRGIIGSLGRSAYLTDDNLLRILVIYALVWILPLALFFLLSFGTGQGGLELDSLPAQLAWGLVSAVATSIEAVVVVVIYHDLRRAKDGADSDEIAAVFD